MATNIQKRRTCDVHENKAKDALRFKPFTVLKSRDTIYFDKTAHRESQLPVVIEAATVVDEIVLEPACYLFGD